MNELGIRALCPTPRSRVELVWKDADGGGNGHVLRGKKCQFAFPVETSGGDRRVRQPVEGHVVEDVVSRKAFALSVEDADDEFESARVMVEHPARKAHWGIRNRIERLRTVRHFRA